MLFRPKNIAELRTPVMLLIPTYSTYAGVTTKTFSDTGDVIFVNFKSYGGTETAINGVFSILDTAEVTTWYRPDITSECRIKLENGAIYDIIATPENYEMQNHFCTFKVQRVTGGA